MTTEQLETPKTAGQKAAETRKANYDNATPAEKAWITRRRKAAAKKAWQTIKSKDKQS